jgi:hypothetical protein
VSNREDVYKMKDNCLEELKGPSKNVDNAQHSSNAWRAIGELFTDNDMNIEGKVEDVRRVMASIEHQIKEAK